MSTRELTRRVRNQAPQRVVRSLRTVVTAWGSATARWRMRPSFIIVGAQRSGTTTLYRVLSEHPDVVRPTQAKGIGYFDVNYSRGPRWYAGHFPLALPARWRTRGRAQAFESSGYYLFHPLAAERIARDLPGTRIVVVVRDPAERAYSAHKHESARGFEVEPFETALALEEERLAGEAERIVAEPGYASFEHRHHAYLGRSRYSEQIARYLELFGASRVHVVDADRFFADPYTEFEVLREWLGLRPWRPSSVEKWNARTGAPLSPELRLRLQEELAPYDSQLAVQMRRTPYWRTSGSQHVE